MKPPLAKGRPDDFQTPPIAIEPLIPYLNKDWTIWECAAGKGNIVKTLENKGYKTISSDMLTNQDFLTYKPEHFDCIITNPPFTLKQEFIKRCYELGKPFALLLPLTTFESKKRQELFEKYGLEVIFLDKRINFETPSGQGSGSWFATAWFTNGLKIGKQITFATLKNQEKLF